MSDFSDQFPLAAEFPPANEADWRRLVEAALKGASFDKRLVSETYDGLRVQPLYPRAAQAHALAGRPAQPWQILQRVDHPDPKAANAQALIDLEGGASGLSLVLAGAPTARGFGVVADNSGDLDCALLDITLDPISLRIETAPFAGRPVAMLVTGLVERRKLDPSQLAIDFGLDPVGDMARTGKSILPWPELSSRAGATARDLAAKGFRNAHLLRADGRAVHEAGGSEAQELGFVLAAGVAYLRLLEASGFTLEDARHRISFLLAADADEFLTIAKFRALRKLWARVEQACGLEPKPATVAAETAWRMMTKRDPYVNMLRTTIAVTAAGIGGADTITVLPFTAAVGLPDAFARRAARNTQIVLLEESNLAKVSDPAAGSGAIEAMTDALARSAWTLFQEIEAAGGAAAALEQDMIQKKIAIVRAAREAAIARRKDAITGTSDYPNLAEIPVAVLDIPKVNTHPVSSSVGFESLPQKRLAEPFERLRDASDRMLAETGARPKVFLANLGKLSDFTARATFAKNFYEAGGIETVTNDGFLSSSPLPVGEVNTDIAALTAAFKASGTTLACLCSSDEVYASEATDAAHALTSTSAIVHLAGRPGDHEAAWRHAGVKSLIYKGCDALAALRAAHDILVK